VGAAPDPSPVQREDEYTIHTIGEVISSPNEHGNVFGTGPSPATAAGFAFYYDTIEIGAVIVDPVPPVDPGTGAEPGIDVLSGEETGVDPNSYVMDDQSLDEWLRDLQRRYSGFGDFQIFYEDFDQYGSNGESIFILDDVDQFGSE